MKYIAVILPVLILSCGAAEIPPLTGGVCLRYDDNQKPEVWAAMMELFAAHDATFSAALNMLDFSPEYFPVVRALAEHGHEIIDHAPNHRMFKFRAADAAEFALYQNHPGVEYADAESRWIYLKYTVKLDVPSHPRGRGNFRDGKLFQVVPAGIFGNIPVNFPRMIYIPAVKKIVAVRKTAEDGVFQVCSFYGSESAGLPELTGAEFIWPRGRGMIQPDDRALELLISVVRRRCELIGIAAPRVWVQPAGWEPVMQSAAMIRTYGKNGYVAADCLEDRLAWYYNDPDFAVSRFGTSARALSLDVAELPAVKTMIADAVAQHQVLTVIAHIRTGNLNKYLSDTAALLLWLKEHDIPLRSMADWTNFLASAQTPRDAQIMPDCRTDRDGDGRPDGFFASQGVQLSIVADGAQLSGRGAGKLEIPGLCGMLKGKNLVKIMLKGPPGSPVRFTFIQRSAAGRVTATAVDGAVFDQDGTLERDFVLDIAPGTAKLYTGMSFISLRRPVILQSITMRAQQ